MRSALQIIMGALALTGYGESVEKSRKAKTQEFLPVESDDPTLLPKTSTDHSAEPDSPTSLASRESNVSLVGAAVLRALHLQRPLFKVHGANIFAHLPHEVDRGRHSAPDLRHDLMVANHHNRRPNSSASFT